MIDFGGKKKRNTRLQIVNTVAHGHQSCFTLFLMCLIARKSERPVANIYILSKTSSYVGNYVEQHSAAKEKPLHINKGTHETQRAKLEC